MSRPGKVARSMAMAELGHRGRDGRRPTDRSSFWRLQRGLESVGIAHQLLDQGEQSVEFAQRILPPEVQIPAGLIRLRYPFDTLLPTVSHYNASIG